MLDKWIDSSISYNTFYIICVFLLYFLCLGRGSQRLRPSPGWTCTARIGLNRRHGSLDDFSFGLRSRIGLGFGEHDLWLGSLLCLGLSGSGFDLSLALPQN